MRLPMLTGLFLVAVAAIPAAAGSKAPQRVERQCQADLFCLETRAFAARAEIWLESLGDRVLTLALAVRSEEGEEPPEPILLTVDGQQRRQVASIPLPRNGPWRVAWDYTYHPGREPARHDDSALYRLPYLPGSAYEVIQSYDGGFSHQGALRFAVDWAMPPGTPVVAVRDGRVIGLWEESDAGSADPSSRGTENFLWVEHDDGSVAHYLHLQAEGVLVARGERVTAGQVVALSGATGYGTRPHLHLHVSTVAHGPDALITFPLRFQTAGGLVIRPAVGRAYRAP